MLDWLIVGGGIHGTHLSFYLTQRLGVPMASVRVLDPHPHPLAQWQRVTANVGMRFLRSPHVHSLHDDPYALVTYARIHCANPRAEFIPTYNRPTLALFNAHSAWLIARHKLDTLRLQGRAQGLIHAGDGWQMQTEHGQLSARNVLLAFGLTEQPYYPTWAQVHDTTTHGAQNLVALPNIRHIFAEDYTPHSIGAGQRVAVVGGGITAAQAALTLAERGARVWLVTRHGPRVHDFDSDTCWVVPQCLERFHALSNYGQRRQMLREVRHRGSMPHDVFTVLQSATDNGFVRVVLDEVSTAEIYAGGVRLHLRADTLEVDQVVLATGLDARRPGGAWLDAAIATHGLATAACGYPIVDQRLRWADGLYVSGALAELEVGPTARNIIGARLAAYRIGEAV
jgi:pyruvate/2-oxoglutarate dehydrogenase complex dihydrolipoamide dehydrogenase (E3) component